MNESLQFHRFIVAFSAVLCLPRFAKSVFSRNIFHSRVVSDVHFTWLSVVLCIVSCPGPQYWARSVVAWKKKKKVCIFILIYGIYCNLSMVKSINALGPSSKKKKKSMHLCTSHFCEGSLFLMAILLFPHWSPPPHCCYKFIISCATGSLPDLC